MNIRIRFLKIVLGAGLLVAVPPHLLAQATGPSQIAEERQVEIGRASCRERV